MLLSSPPRLIEDAALSNWILRLYSALQAVPWNGQGFTEKIAESAINYVLEKDISTVLITNTAVPRTVTLTEGYSQTGRILIIKDASGGAAGNNITISSDTGKTIDGAANILINTNWGVRRILYDGTNYLTV